nr:TonB-dependent receptor plug domain-containing protein [Gemmatimonadota bacterium]
MLAVLAATGAQAQTPAASISGAVRDLDGTAVAGATVRVTNTATGVTRTTITVVNGTYSVSGLTAGVYAVSASLFGFRGASSRSETLVDGDVIVNLVLDPLQVEALTVTAMLREQAVEDVPFSIAAPTAEVIRSRGADNIEGIAANVAGFNVQNLGPGQSQVSMRGASSGQIARDQPGVKEQVGAYLDDAPISLSLFTPDLDLFDISRVEVLRGPQGTLFGAGSLAGTVRYISNQPEPGVHRQFGEVGGNVIAGGGAGGNIKLGANVPLGGRNALRVVGYHNQVAGYMDAVQPGGSVNEDVNTGQRTGVRAA